VGTIVLQVDTPSAAGRSSLAIDFPQSTAASLLGFLPSMGETERAGSQPAQLTGNETEPFALVDGSTLAVRVNGGAAQVVPFSASDFADLAAATADEVVAVLNTGLSQVTARRGSGGDFIVRGGDESLEGAGRLVVEGVEVLHEADLAYASQPLYENAGLADVWGVDPVPALTTPSGTDREDVVYLDVWDREVSAAEDDTLVLPAVGVETAVRLRREWAVRVAEGATDLSGMSRLPGHRYGILAHLVRPADEDALEADAIRDQRTLNLNVAKYLKTPVFFTQGAEVVNDERYATILENLRSVLLMRRQERVFDFDYADTYDEMLVWSTLQDLTQQCAFAAIQVRAATLNTADARRFLGTLYDLQSGFVDVVEAHGNDGGDAQAFVDGYRQRLNNASTGLGPAQTADDFLGAVEAQETINGWLSEPVDELPEGDLVIVLRSVEPDTPPAVGVPFNVTYRVESQVTSPRDQERILLAVESAAPSTWDLSLNRDELIVTADGGQGEAVVSVTPRAGTLSTVLRLTATAARNPVITQSHDSEPFTLGEAPPADVFLQWSAPPLDEETFLIEANDVPGSVAFQVDLINTSETNTQTFELSHFVTLPDGEESDWTPLETSPASSVTAAIDPGATQTNTLTVINGPTASTVGAEGTLTVRATLVQENGTSVADGKSRDLVVPFRIVSP